MNLLLLAAEVPALLPGTLLLLLCLYFLPCWSSHDMAYCRIFIRILVHNFTSVAKDHHGPTKLNHFTRNNSGGSPQLQCPSFLKLIGSILVYIPAAVFSSSLPTFSFQKKVVCNVVSLAHCSTDALLCHFPLVDFLKNLSITPNLSVLSQGQYWAPVIQFTHIRPVVALISATAFPVFSFFPCSGV